MYSFLKAFLVLMKLFILDHNFSTRNARKSIKGSKDSDLVCIFLNGKFEIFVFVGNVISGVGFSIYGWGHRSLSPNYKNRCFDLSF